MSPQTGTRNGETTQRAHKGQRQIADVEATPTTGPIERWLPHNGSGPRAPLPGWRRAHRTDRGNSETC